MRAWLAIGLLTASAYGASTKLPEGVKVLRDLEYAQVKGVSLKLDLYRPSAMPSAPMPLVIWVHGGGWSNGSKTNCPAVWLATKGYTVASLDFRLLPEHPWPAQIEDPIAALRWLRQESGKYGFDASRSAAMGGSSGGHVVAVAAGDPRVAGVIAVQSYTPDYLYTRRDQELLSFVSFHIAQALERRQAHESLREAYAELEQRVAARTSELADANRELLDQISVRERMEHKLKHEAMHDTLTGLPNRSHLLGRMGLALSRYRHDPNQLFAVLFLDLDRFKDINDSLGHAAGDRLLKAAATRLQATVGASDTVARLGGDEFTVVLEDVESIPAVERMAREILTAFSMPLEVDERHDVSITPSLGISLYPDHALVPTDLLKFADTAMYQAKAEGRNTYQIYNETMDAESRRRATVLASLRKALDRGEFRLVYQPRMALADGRITGVEALLRWHSAELGEIPPTVFVPLAEESGLILQIGDWVLNEAMQTLKRWRAHGLNEISIGVNVSVLQLLRGNLPEELRRLIQDLGVPANRIELEVTESMVMQNAEQTTHVLNELRKLGITLAIDDFGTGYSSLVYLKRLPIDTLKIDKEFIGDLTKDPDDEAITATVITMGHSLGLNVIAEGVESEQQLSYLREQGCDEIQGFWLSPPLDSHRCLAFIRSWQPGTVAAIPAPY